MHLTTAEVSERAHKYERENVLVHWIALGLTPLLVTWIVYRLYRLVLLQNYVLVATMSWLLLTFLYVIWRFLRNGPRRTNTGEPCAQFLKREFEGKRQLALAIRRWILFLVPAVLAAWWGGGPALTAKRIGVQSDWLLQVHAPVPLIVTLSVLALVWFGMGMMAQRAHQEIEKIVGK